MRTIRIIWAPLCALLLITGLPPETVAGPPVVRSTAYNGAYSNIVFHPVQAWMNTNTVLTTVEAWIYCNDVNGFQAFVARHYTTNLWFGLSGNRLRFYRSGGTFADSDGTVVVYRWTHVAVTYDGTSARFFINGVAAGTKPLASAGNNCTNSFSLGGQRDLVIPGDTPAGGYAFNGYLDEVRVWSVVRSGAAIAGSMNDEVRTGTGLLATFGTGSSHNDIAGSNGSTAGIPVADRWSGFGILPDYLCIPRTGAGLRVDGNIDMLNEYRGAETLVMRSTVSSIAPDNVAYLMVSANSTNNHLYVGVPALAQAGLPQIPVVQLLADVNVANGTTNALGDWECGISQDSFQGGTIYGVNPPFFPNLSRLSWGQSVSNWQAFTAGAFEFHQSYEFRIHARHLNYFTNSIGLMVRYYDYDAGGDQSIGPRSAVTNRPSTYALVDWCGQADRDLSAVAISGSVTNISGNVGVAGRPVSLYSGDSELGGLLVATTVTDAQGKFTFPATPVPSERRLAVAYSAPAGVVFLDPAIDSSSSPLTPFRTNSPLSVTYPACPVSCSYARVNFRYRQLGPVQITGVTPSSVPASVVLRNSPLKRTATETITITGTNFPPGAHVYFRGSGCGLIPPSLCTSDWEEANITSLPVDGLSIVAEVPLSLTGVSTTTRGFQIVVENPSFGSSGGSQWNYGPSVFVNPPTWAQLYGFEFKNMDDGPSWEEFEACYGDSIFATVPFTDIPLPGLRDPYYGIYFLIYMAWMDAAHGSCSGIASTSRLMAEGDIPIAAFDRPDSGDGVHGVIFPSGYVGRPPCETDDTRLCAPKPYRWTGFDLFQPFRPINIWARITSFQGAQTSAEFLNIWLGQLHRPVVVGPRTGISVGDPVLVLNRLRSDVRNNLVILGGRDFQTLHTVAPYGVVDDQGLMDDLLTTQPRTGFSLIKVSDSNWPNVERFLEVNRSLNTFRYLIGFGSGGSPIVVDGAGLYYLPTSVFRGRRHALGPADIAANLAHFAHVLHTGTTTSGIQDAAGGTAGWTATNIINTYEGAQPAPLPGFVFGQPDRFDRTMFFLPDTNAPTRAWFFSGGSNVFLHYGLGGGDIAFGFRAPNTGASNSVDGILIGLNEGLNAVGLRAGAPVTGFGAVVASRDGSGQSRVFILDSDGGAMTPDVQLERNKFKTLTIRNRSAAAFGFRLNVAGNDATAGPFEQLYEFYTQPGNSTVTLRLPDDPANRMLTRELDSNNDGVPESVEDAPAKGQLRIAKESGLLAIRWRQAGFGETLEATKIVGPASWSPVNATVSREGLDQVARVESKDSASYYRLRLTGTNCLSLSSFALGPRPNPWETNGFKFEALSSTGSLLAQNSIASRGGHTGLDVQQTMRLQSLEDCDAMHIDVFQTSGLVTFEAIGSLGSVVARQVLTDVGTAPQRVSLRGFSGRVQSVRVISPNASCVILNVCSERAQASNKPKSPN